MYNSNNWSRSMRVSTADFIRNYSVLADKALAEPVTITKHGRDRLVMLSAAEYERLKRRDRRVVASEEISDEEASLIAQAKVSPEHSNLDAELGDWTP
jgi:PHD/YefM family antitoxin component YafN of YafNO toxin-antitoxin module